MKRANDFEPVADCQAVFRRILEAFSNPGRVVDLSAQAARLREESATALAVAAALVDNETTFAAVGDEGLARAIALLTNGKPAEAGDAGYLFVERALDAERIAALLEAAPCGTLEEPHRSAIVFVRVEDFPAAPGLHLRGPGIEDTIAAPLCPYAGQWLARRAALGLEYPCGIDLAFYTGDGRLLAAPRLVRQAGGEGA